MMFLSRNQVVVYLLATSIVAILIASREANAANVKHFDQETEEEEPAPSHKSHASMVESKVF
jgi:hypothetical protein